MGTTTNPVCIGSSCDQRTNRWRVTCPKCEKPFEPHTTLRATQYLDCPKCGAQMVADYNAEPPVVTLIGKE